MVPLHRVPGRAWVARTLRSYMEGVIDARRLQTTGQRGCQNLIELNKGVMANHPLPWSQRASARMPPTRVAGLFSVRSRNPTSRRSRRRPGHDNYPGYEQRQSGHPGVHGHVSDWEKGSLIVSW
jgi:hypothetical protein